MFGARVNNARIVFTFAIIARRISQFLDMFCVVSYLSEKPGGVTCQILTRFLDSLRDDSRKGKVGFVSSPTAFMIYSICVIVEVGRCASQRSFILFAFFYYYFSAARRIYLKRYCCHFFFNRLFV